MGLARMSANAFRGLLQAFSVWSGVPTPRRSSVSFAKLARQFHPDVNPMDAGAEPRSKKISEALRKCSQIPESARKLRAVSASTWSPEWVGAFWRRGAPRLRCRFRRYGTTSDDFIQRPARPASVVKRAVPASQVRPAASASPAAFPDEGSPLASVRPADAHRGQPGFAESHDQPQASAEAFNGLERALAGE